jgi:uracil phosphoribosyltransferase
MATLSGVLPDVSSCELFLLVRCFSTRFNKPLVVTCNARILLEEALAVLGTESVEVITGTGHLYHGLERKHQFCGVSIGAEGFPFLVLFHQMEPDAPQGSIHVEPTTDRRGQRAWRLDHMDLPANIIQFKILLFSSTCSTGEAECKAIEVNALLLCW